jgi:hypothetical protein
MQVDRQTEVGKTDVQIYLPTNGNKDLQTYTDKQTDRRTVQKYWYRLKNRQMYRKTNIHTYGTYQQYCTKDRQTDRQDRQKIMTNRPTHRQTASI